MNREDLIIEVTIRSANGDLIRRYRMNHDSAAERRVLGEQCRNAFEAGQQVSTRPVRGEA